MLRTLGLSLVGVFVPVYLYQLGYGVDAIALFFALVFGFRVVTDLLGAWLVGYFGPKHIMILSHIFLVLTLSLLLSLETTMWPLGFVAFMYAIALGFFFTAYHIEFSKLQSVKRAGSQISTMYRLGKFSSAIGPLVGGVIATFVSVQVSIFVALTIIMISAIPLALSPEPVRTRQHVTWKGFPWKETKWDFISNMGLSFDQMAYVFIWPLYASIFIFTDDVYLAVGIMTSLGLFVSVLNATILGKLIDRGKGRILMTIGVALQSMAHALRTVITLPIQAMGFNAGADSLTSAIRMPYTKGVYAQASRFEGYRDAYIGAIMTSSNIVRSSIFLILFFLTQHYSDQDSMKLTFLIAAVTVWGALLARFKVLK